ncbi:Adenylate kinase 7 [Channa argus]|uniref:Adenylate kinase 7 n=1 Tax=Channa argus TaxID=215402 RepID=A0A6G1QG85_CHAAH|nr:Adenylate kinase 7 [Channa argus]
MMEKIKQSPKRVFINNIDCYASKCIAKFLSEYVVGALPEPDEEAEEEAEEEKMIPNQSRTPDFQVVGTVSEILVEDRPYVLEEYLHMGRDELLPKLLNCDVVIYNITQHTDQVEEALWAVSALHNEINSFSGPKMFILISTVMTWACSKSIDPHDPELPFTDEVFWQRKAHPNFSQHIDLEKTVAKLGKTNRKLFSTYVVASGLQYGMGEQIFHYFFKNVIEHSPKPYYLLAVDSSNNTMEDIVKVCVNRSRQLFKNIDCECVKYVAMKNHIFLYQTVASALGPGKIQKKHFEEVFLTRDLSAMEIDSLLVNLRMESVYLKELSINWLCESGLVENIELVVEEYRQTRGLLDNTLKNADADAEHEDSAADAQELLNSIKDSMEKHGAEEHESEDETSHFSSFSKKILPGLYIITMLSYMRETTGYQFVLCLDASDTLLKDRVMNLPERLVQLHNYEQEHFQQRLARYRKTNMEDETVVNYFDQLDINPLYLEITSSDEPDCLLLMQKIFDTVGKPRNYGLSTQEIEEEERRKAEEEMRREGQVKAEEEQREAEEARQRAARWEEWTKGLEKERQQEEELLEVQSVPMRNYLMKHVMPILTRGLMECCKVRPQDPVDFLAEYLFKNNPVEY